MKNNRKTLKIAVIVLAVALICPLIVTAASWNIRSNPGTEVASAAPVLDGNITDNEGWSVKERLDTDTAGFFAAQNPLTGEADLCFAYTDEGLYFAVDYTDYGAAYTVRFYDSHGSTLREATYPCAEAGTFKYEDGKYPAATPDGYPISYYKINEHKISGESVEINHGCLWNIFANDCEWAAGPGNSVVFTTGESEKSTFGDYYWNGDTFSLALDLCGKFLAAGYDANTDHTQQYCFGLTEDGTVKVARTFDPYKGAREEITALCPGKGTATENGFRFEAMIPWSVLVEDANRLAHKLGADFTFTEAEVKAAGAEHKAAVTLRDMYVDEKTGKVSEYGRYITVCEYLPCGTPGYLSCGDSIACYGLDLKIK